MANREIVCGEINYAIIGIYVKPVLPGVPASLTAAAPAWLRALVASPAAPARAEWDIAERCPEAPCAELMTRVFAF